MKDLKGAHKNIQPPHIFPCAESPYHKGKKPSHAKRQRETGDRRKRRPEQEKEGKQEEERGKGGKKKEGPGTTPLRSSPKRRKEKTDTRPRIQ